ncbi:hypothetical protein AKO1_001131 [Acrasis kona]|uniref:Uncharacterized protein n=1 Tax=Acrasis kona TaxID=1008807 RepID=A0AAW2ZE14_9EUKA
MGQRLSRKMSKTMNKCQPSRNLTHIKKNYRRRSELIVDNLAESPTGEKYGAIIKAPKRMNEPALRNKNRKQIKGGGHVFLLHQ